MSSRVSYYEIQCDDSEMVKQKSSGVIVCTGSTSVFGCGFFASITLQHFIPVICTDFARKRGYTVMYGLWDLKWQRAVGSDVRHSFLPATFY